MSKIHIVSRAIEFNPENCLVSIIGAFSNSEEASRVAEEQDGLQEIRSMAEELHARIYHWVKSFESPAI